MAAIEEEILEEKRARLERTFKALQEELGSITHPETASVNELLSKSVPVEFYGARKAVEYMIADLEFLNDYLWLREFDGLATQEGM